MRILLTALVFVWTVVLFGNVAAAGRTAGQMRLRDDISEGEARRRTLL